MTQVAMNYWAILVCAIASMVLGSLWYGPVFGKFWMKAVGIDPNMDSAAKKEMQKQAVPGYIAMFLGSLVMAYILKHFLVYAGASTVGAGLAGAFWIWLGFYATTGLGLKFFENKSWAYYWVNELYHLVNLLIFSIILVSWK